MADWNLTIPRFAGRGATFRQQLSATLKAVETKVNSTGASVVLNTNLLVGSGPSLRNQLVAMFKAIETSLNSAGAPSPISLNAARILNASSLRSGAASLFASTALAINGLSDNDDTIARILVLWGQSNMQGLGTAIANTGGVRVMPTGWTKNINHKIYTNGSLAVYEPFVNSNPSQGDGTWGPEAAFLAALTAANPKRKYFVVKLAVGGTGLALNPAQANWNIAQTGNYGLYNSLTSQINAVKALATAQGLTPVVVFAASRVGEEDAKDSTNAAAHGANQAALIAAARTDWGVSRFAIAQLSIDQTNTSFAVGWSAVRAGQAAVAAADQNVEIVTSDGEPTFDQTLHLTPAAIDRLGASFYWAYTKSWQTEYPGLSWLADIGKQRCVYEFVPGDPTSLKTGLPANVLTNTNASTTARTYINSLGVRKNDLAANTLRFSYYSDGKRRLVNEGSAQNAITYGRDLTNAAWTATNITVIKDQTGWDGVANSGCRITATAPNATILFPITAGSARRVSSTDTKQLVGTGPLQMTQDGGTTWVTLPVTSTGITRVEIPAQTVVNPSVGFRIVNSGDSFFIDAVQCEVGEFATSAIYTSGSAVTRAADNIAVINTQDTQGTPAFMFLRGKAAVSTTAVFFGGDSNVGILYRSTLANRLYTNNGVTNFYVDATSGNFLGSYGVATTFDSSIRKISMNGSVPASDNQVPTTRTGPISIGMNSAHAAGTALGGGIDAVGGGYTLLTDEQLQAMAMAA